MMMTARNRANGTHEVGPGGRYCVCCDHAPRMNRAVRRHVKRAERQLVRREITTGLMDYMTDVMDAYDAPFGCMQCADHG